MAGGKAPRKRRPVKAHVRYSEALAARICRRVAAGEILHVICREARMPRHGTVCRWVQERPDFAERLAAAKAEGGRPAGSVGVVSTYAPEIAEEIFRRLCEGRSIVEICRDPAMPCAMTVYNWRQKHPEFAELVRLGREVQAELFFDLGWEMAKAATPETAYLTHVRLGHLRWMVGSMAPRIYRIRQVEPEAPPKRQDVLFRHFKVEVDPETGERRVASYVANPETGEVERQDAPGWRRPPGVVMLPGG